LMEASPGVGNGFWEVNEMAHAKTHYQRSAGTP